LHLAAKTYKPVVMVGAMRPYTATSADGPMNLYQAVALARSDAAKDHGVMVVFSDGIYSARDVTKVNTFKTDAFSGRDIGCLGYMRDDTPYFFHKSLQPHTLSTPFDVTGLDALPSVGIAYFHIDADPAVLDFMFAHYDGVVLAGAGDGLASSLWSDRAARLIAETGKPFVRSARIANGMVNFQTNGAISAGNLNPQKARVLLQLALTVTRDHQKIGQYFATY
jgi:L-asparaginase